MTMLLIAMIGCYAAGAMLPLVLAGRPRAQILFAHGLAAIGSAIGMAAGIAGLLAAAPLRIALPSTLPLLTFAFRLDGLAAFFLLVISLIGLAVSIYAIGYVGHWIGKASIGALSALFNLFFLSMALVVLADNGVFFLMAWEAMSLVSFLLVLTDHEREQTRQAALFYVIMAHLGTAFIVLAFLVFFQASGSFAFDAFRDPQRPVAPAMRSLAFLLALVGFGAKAGIVPLHVWLPRAHPAAPSHISAVMSGVMIKTAIYGLFRVMFDFLGGTFPAWWGVVVLTVGVVSALLGVLYALMEHDLKSLLAFHSVENIGIILIGIGAGMLFQTYGLTELAALALMAGLYHVLNHAVFKALLFMGAGAVVSATGTANMEEYGGLLRRMPWTGACFLIGAVSIVGLPPLNGFMSEWLIFQSLFLGTQLPALVMKLMLPIAAAMLALTGALALACFAKAFGISFLARPRSEHAEHAQEVEPSMRAGMVILAAACVILGIAPFAVIPVLDPLTSAATSAPIASRLLIAGGWAVAPVGVEFASVAPAILGLMVALIAGLAWASIRVLCGRHAVRWTHTWGCGIRLTPAMEYTATGFVQPIKRIFSLVYQPTVKVESEMLEESRYFAKRRRFAFRIEPVFERYLYQPVVDLVQRAGERARAVQAGSLHLYLAYIFLTLIAILLIGR